VEAAEAAEGDLLNAQAEEAELTAEVAEELLDPVDEVRDRYAERYGQALEELRVLSVSRPFDWERGAFGPRERVPLMIFSDDDVTLAG
jgi:hypothetical protein